MISQIQIKIYEIAVGPIHHDILLEKDQGRISFDILMS
jgi:hypothetical protein